MSTQNRLLFADIIIPVPIPKLFTYHIPEELKGFAKEGVRVVVAFGRGKILTGVINRIHQSAPKHYKTKALIDILDDQPSFTVQQLSFMHWVSEYYMSSIGEVLQAAIPSGLKLTSDTFVKLNNEDKKVPLSSLSENEKVILENLQLRKILSYKQIKQLLEGKSYLKDIKSLLDKDAILLSESFKEKYSPKMETRVRLCNQWGSNETFLEELFKKLEKKPKQLEILMAYLQKVNIIEQPSENDVGISKKDLLFGELSSSSLQTLTKNGIFETFEVQTSRLNYFADKDADFKEPLLTEYQKEAESSIYDFFREKPVVLLHGVTGSGKTAIYINLIKEAIAGGSQVLYLLPEIALTTQIVVRLRKVFGNTMGVYHSKFSDNERVEVWNGLLNDKFSLVVGVRSSVFLPFDNLGLIIVDEEHEISYKQFDPAPRYNARDAALILAQKHDAKVLLGSATPSIPSYYFAKKDKYGLVNLQKRYGDASLPEIALADTRSGMKKKTMRGSFSHELISAIESVLKNNEQGIIFQNRRGYANYLSCETCGWVPYCPYCDVSLTYHLYKQEIKCHYCGYKEKVPEACPACGVVGLKSMGYGTEKLEEDLQAFFPEAKVQRMDFDTTRKKNSYRAILEQFSQGEIDLLVGTQMVSKGLDFDKVSLVGILDIDRMIHFPDFRANERAFQLITQVSGRSGRREKRGRVIIQTNNPSLALFETIIRNDFSKLYEEEIIERKEFLYPPFSRLLKIVIKHREQDIAKDLSEKIAEKLREKVGEKLIYGPQEALIHRVRNQYLMNIYVKLLKNINDLTKLKSEIQHLCVEIQYKEKHFKGATLIFDVDPY